MRYRKLALANHRRTRCGEGGMIISKFPFLGRKPPLQTISQGHKGLSTKRDGSMRLSRGQKEVRIGIVIILEREKGVCQIQIRISCRSRPRGYVHHVIGAVDAIFPVHFSGSQPGQPGRRKAVSGRIGGQRPGEDTHGYYTLLII